MHELHELKDKLMKELEEYSGNAKFSKEDVETIKYMASAIDHICNIADGDEDYSSRYMGGVYSDGMDGRSYRRSYARRRDSMGRYSGERGYSRADLADRLRDLMADAPDERTRQDIQRMAEKIENA